MLLATVGHEAFAQACPASDPSARPIGTGKTQSTWSLTKIVQEMRHPHQDLVLLTSHRGYWEYCPENTLESFQAAWDMGAEGIEMDVRMSAPGSDLGVTYPNGEVFLSHDFDLRGEAPLVSGQSSNYIYNLSPGALRVRPMVDRHGLQLRNSRNLLLYLHSLTDLLNAYYQRALAVGGVQKGGSPIGGWDLITNGPLLTIDVKGYNDPRGGGKTQYETLLECLLELNAFQNAKTVDLRNAIAFKVGYREFTAKAGFPDAFGNVLEQQLYWQKEQAYPQLIFIVFPIDGVTCSISPQPGSPCVCPPDPKAPQGQTCSQLSPDKADLLNAYANSYGNIQGPSFLLVDWQSRTPGNALEAFLTSRTAPSNDNPWFTWGIASFLASNNFAEGVRNSNGTCYQIQGGLNTSYCVSDPVGRWASSSLEYLVPFSGGTNQYGGRATAVTTDQYENAKRYLDQMNKNNTNYIKQ